MSRGSTCPGWSRRRDRCRSRNACFFVHQAALGLQHAHEEGLVHRDIKPGNLMLSRKKEKATIKVLDFGLAKVTREEKVDGGLTSEGQALGTPDYIAPEQIGDATKADIRADIYSLGGTLYHLLTGRPPFQAGSSTTCSRPTCLATPIHSIWFVPRCLRSWRHWSPR